jgi:hypothetical protein
MAIAAAAACALHAGKLVEIGIGQRVVGLAHGQRRILGGHRREQHDASQGFLQHAIKCCKTCDLGRRDGDDRRKRFADEGGILADATCAMVERGDGAELELQRR